MRKILTVLLLVLLLTGCKEEKKKEEPVYLDMPSTYKVDMSEYNNLKAFAHQFVGVSVEEIFNALDNGGSGVFYLGYETCPWCNSILYHVNDVAKEHDQTIYYIDVYAEEPDFLAYYDKFLEVFDAYLDENSEGKKALFTPLFIFIYNGEILSVQTGIPSEWNLTGNSEKLVNKVKDNFDKQFSAFD